ncbi:MAG: T9SS type A sorting domain-containing protein, partial [Bacteroidota bacterium]
DGVLDFEGAGVGECWVWGLSYTGNITAAVGDNAGAVELTDDCADLSDNFVTVFRDNPEGGMVDSDKGVVIYTCPGDGVADDFVMSTNSMANSNYGYVITNPDLEILGISPDGVLDFEGAGVGECWVWGLSYTGNITAAVGDNASAVELTDDCADLSDNFVTVFRDNPEGGMVGSDKGEVIYTCPGDGVADGFVMSTNSIANSNYTYVITNPDLEILGISPDGVLDFEGAGVGECWVWGLSYTGNITAAVGDNAGAIDLTDDCFDLSDNFVTVFRDNPDGGMVTSDKGETFYTCPGDDIADDFVMENNSTANSNYAYVITSSDLEILGVSPDGVLDFEGAGVGECWVWGLSYTGNITAMVGDNAAAVELTDDCFSLSENFVTVIRDMPEGGTVTSDMGDMVMTCAGDDEADIIQMENNSSSTSNYTYVITDPNLEILGVSPTGMIDFEPAGPGECWVWGLSFTGELQVGVGDNAGIEMLSDDCFELSENFVTVIRTDDPDFCTGFTGGNSGLSIDNAQSLPGSDIEIRPNPAVEQAQVLFQSTKVSGSLGILTIYNLNGQLLYEKQVVTDQGANVYDINVGHFPQGLYLVRLQQGSELSSKKFIKQ